MDIPTGHLGGFDDGAIFDNAAVGIAFTGDRHFRRCNARWLEMFGYRAEEMIGRHASIIYHSESDYQQLGDSARTVLGAGEAFETDVAFRRKDGSSIWCHLYGRAVDRHRPGRGTVWIAEDITGLRRAQQELQAVFQAAALGIAVVRERRVVNCNPSLEQLFGYAPGAMNGGSTRDWYETEEDFRVLGESAYPDLAQGIVHRREQRFRRQDGSVFWGRMSGRAFNAAEPHGGSVWLIEDVSDRHRQERELLRARHELEAVFETAGVGIAILRQRTVLHCNRRFEELFGAEPGAMVGESTRTWYASDEDFEGIGASAYDDLRRGELNRREQLLVRRDGSSFWARLNGRAFDPADPHGGSVWVVEDISERKKHEAFLRSSLDEQQMIFENAAVGIMLVRNRIVQRCNHRLERLFGYADGELDGRSTQVFFIDQAAFEAQGREAYAALAQAQTYHCECQVRRKDGSVFWVRATGHRTDDGEAGIGVIWILDDVSERRAIEEALLRAHDELERRVEERTSELASANAQLQAEVVVRMMAEEKFWHIAHHDVLTGLPNRSLLQDRLSQAVAQAERNRHKLGLLFIDLDRFKHINDTLGHDIGDVFLRGVAAAIRGAVRGSDTVARLGGDEFVVLLQELANADDALLVARKILETLAEPINADGHLLHPSASIGISLYPDDAADVGELMRNADTAMYHAKAAGRNNFRFFAAPMNEEASRFFLLEQDLRQVLVEEHFELHYQPLVDVTTARVCGIEALIRWRHPQRGLIPPAEFIPVAEDTGLILAIGDWVLARACRQAVEWTTAGHPAVPVSVNFSPREFAKPDLVEAISRVLAESGLPPQRLEIEITEACLVRESDAGLAKLKALAAMGVRIAIDDFGTGYSSLSHLKRFPVHRLKIDRSFIAELCTERDSAAIVGAIVGLARGLGLSLVAEGVEDAGQLAALTEIGCGVCQGYYFARPQAATEAAAIFGAAVAGAQGHPRPFAASSARAQEDFGS